MVGFNELSDKVEIYFEEKNTLSEESLDMQVWLVTMDGIWLPANVPDVVQKPYQHLSIIIDAKTGQEIYRNMQP